MTDFLKAGIPNRHIMSFGRSEFRKYTCNESYTLLEGIDKCLFVVSAVGQVAFCA